MLRRFARSVRRAVSRRRDRASELTQLREALRLAEIVLYAEYESDKERACERLVDYLRAAVAAK